MSHLRLVPSLPDDEPEATPTPYDDAQVVALAFFQKASGICLCRECTKRRHPAFVVAKAGWQTW